MMKSRKEGFWTGTRREVSIVAFVFLFQLLPFINKPVHIDDPLFIWTAQHVLDHPVNFYGFDANWAYSPQPMHEVNRNPPLTAYYLAFASLFFGWSEFAMHFAMLLPALAFGLGVYFLAGELCRRPLSAALIAVTAPGVVLSATTIMADVPMVALYVWAFYFWVRGVRENRPRFLAVSGVVAGLAFLAKYFALSLLPLIATYTLARYRLRWKSLVWLALPVAIVCGYQWWTSKLYGTGSFGGAVDYANAFHKEDDADGVARALTGLSFVGGCFGTYWVIVHAHRTRWAIASILAVSCAMFAVIRVASNLDWFPLSEEGELSVRTAWHLAFFIGCGLQLVWLAGRSAWTRRDAVSLTLLCWVAGTLVFACFLNHFVTARVILPLLPALAILVARELETGASSSLVWWKSVEYLAVIPSMAVSMAVCGADASLAGAAKRAAGDILAGNEPDRIQFSGHWGFQYYMQQGGARAIDANEPLKVWVGAVYVNPGTNSNTVYLDPGPIEASLPGSKAVLEVMEYRPMSWLATMDSVGGAGFYSAVWGPIPYQFGPVPIEQYSLVRVGRALPTDKR